MAALEDFCDESIRKREEQRLVEEEERAKEKEKTAKEKESPPEEEAHEEESGRIIAKEVQRVNWRN